MRIVMRRGLSVPLGGPPRQEIDAGLRVGCVALLGSDSGYLRTEVLVDEGDRVEAGTPLYRDRNRAGLVFVSPVAGTVREVAIGARRRLTTLVIEVDGDDAVRFDTSSATQPDGLRSLLLKAGQWPAFRQRPFERIPEVDAVPDAIFVTAIDTAPHAPDPAVVLASRKEDFEAGLDAVAGLTDGPLYVCQPDGELITEPRGRILVAQFVGEHPAGLPGTHIARLSPVAAGSKVWHIGYQDVAAIGRLLRTGKIEANRVVALSGPGVRDPRLVSVPLGADLHQLVRPEMTQGPKQILSGSVLSGQESRHLFRYHSHVTVLNRKKSNERHWLIAALRKIETPPAFIPTQALEQSLGADIPVVPLLRAVSIGDTESAERLGCIQLAEDDLALASYAAGGDVDFGAKLRAILDELEAAA